MKQIRAVIVDDELQNIKVLVQILEMYCKQIEVVATSQNINDAELKIIEHNPEIIFLDIEMPFGNGFDLLARFKKINFEIIFITAYNQYAVQAIKSSAIDYLLKPVHPAELKKAVDKAIEKIEFHNVDKRVETLLLNANIDNISKRKICIHTSDVILFEEVGNIMYIQAEGNYVHIFFKHKQKEIIAKNLQDFESILPEKLFCRIHNSFIINIDCIKKYNKGRGGFVTMENDFVIEVSVRRKDDFLKIIN